MHLSEGEFVEDGYVCEAVYNFSYTVEKLKELSKSPSGLYKRMMLIGDLTSMCKSAVSKCRDASPLGLADVSIMDRFNLKQKSYVKAIRTYIDKEVPELSNRLFKNECLWDYMMCASIVAMDEVYAALKGESPNIVMCDFMNTREE